MAANERLGEKATDGEKTMRHYESRLDQKRRCEIQRNRHAQFAPPAGTWPETLLAIAVSAAWVLIATYVFLRV